MMNRKHEGISCDFCHKSGFSFRRYKCLLCFDYDLCGPCFDFKRESNNHRSEHPMQCLLTKYDYGLFYAGETQTDLAFSYTCPICGRLGNNIFTLKEHLNQDHSDSNIEVICSICASISDGNSNQQTRNLGYHIATKHTPLLSPGNNQGKNRKIIEANTPTKAAGETSQPATVHAQSYSSGNIFTTNDQRSSASSEEPLLHTLLNHLYTWRTRRDNTTATNKTIVGIPDSNVLPEMSKESTVSSPQSMNRMAVQMINTSNVSQSSSALSRSSTLRSTIQDRNKSIRKKLGTRHIIDLTGDNWRLLDPDNELFSLDDDDLESISLNLNQPSIQFGDVDESEYIDDEDDIASMIPWGQDLGPESIFNQLRALYDPKPTISSSNNSYIRLGGTVPAIEIVSNQNPAAAPAISAFEKTVFKLAHNVITYNSCDFPSDTDNTTLSVSLEEHIGQQGLFINDLKDKKERKEENILKLRQRSYFIRDLVLSTFLSKHNPLMTEFSSNISVSSKDLFGKIIIDN